MTDITDGGLAELSRIAREALDRARIAEIPSRYARGTDSRDLDEVLGLFAPEAFVEGSRVALPYREYYPKLAANIAYYKRLMHYISNQIVSLDGDRGRVQAYCHAYHWSAEALAANAEAELKLGVIYVDDVARIDGQWLITHRKVHPQWRIGDYHADWNNG